MEEKKYINSCVVRKGKLWTQILPYITESTQELVLKSEIYRRPISCEKWSNSNNKIK